MPVEVYQVRVPIQVEDDSPGPLSTARGNVRGLEREVTTLSARLASLTAPLRALARAPFRVTLSLLDQVSAPLRAIRSSLAGIASGITMGLGMQAAGLITQGMGLIGGSIVGMNADLQTAQLQFENLMGSADAAKQHVADLFQFAKSTPFESQPVIDASKTMRVFGGDALDTMENLTRVGNAAAIAGAPINEVAFWTGRMFAAMRGGQAFGESIARLQELAILTPETATKLQALSSSGTATAASFGLVTKDLDRYAGGMDKLQFTWAGLTSTFSDTVKILGATAFRPLFAVLSDGLMAVNNALGAGGVQDAITSFSQTLADGLVRLQGLAGTVLGQLGPALTSVSALFIGFTSDAGAFGLVGDMIEEVFGRDAANAVRPFLQSLMDVVGMLQRGEFGLALLSIPGRIVRAFVDAGGRVISYVRGHAAEWFAGLRDAVTTLGPQLAESLRFVVFDVANELGLAGPLGAAVAWLSETAWPAVRDAASTALGIAADLWSNRVLPAAHGALDWAADRWADVQGAASTALGAAGDFWATTVQPAAHRVLDWLTGPAWEGVKTAAGGALGWVRDTAWPWVERGAQVALQTASTFWETELRPRAVAVLGWLRDTAWPWVDAAAHKALDWAVSQGFPALRRAAEDALGWMTAPAEGGGFSGLAASLGTLTMLATQFGQAVGPLVLEGWVIGLRELGEAGALLGPKLERLGAAVAPVLEVIGGALGLAALVVARGLGIAFAALVPIVGQFLASKIDTLSGIFEALGGSVKWTVAFFSDLVALFQGKGAPTMVLNDLAAATSELVDLMAGAVDLVFPGVGTFLKDTLPGAINVALAPLRVFWDVMQPLIEGLRWLGEQAGISIKINWPSVPEALQGAIDFLRGGGLTQTAGPASEAAQTSGGGSGGFEGARAAGGPVLAGRRYWVGERGPEPFVPSVNGTILPAGGGGATVTLHAGAVVLQVSTPDLSEASIERLARLAGERIAYHVSVQTRRQLPLARPALG